MTLPSWTLPPDYGDGDNGWGGQNDYAIYGQLRVPLRESLIRTYNSRYFGIRGDGSTDDTANWNTAIAAINAAGGGLLQLGPGRHLIHQGLLSPNVFIRGAGRGATILQLPNASNTDVLWGGASNVALINIAGANGSGFGPGAPTLWNFGISDLTIDGNYANQSGGPCFPLRFYGYGYILERVEFRNGYSGCVLCDYNGAFPSSGLGPADDAGNNWRVESTWNQVTAHHALGTTTAIGIEMGGPHDSRMTNVLSYHTNGHAFHSGPNNGGLQTIGCHMWQSGLADANSCTWLQEGTLYASDCEAEGSPYMQWVLLANGCDWFGGSVYDGNRGGAGIQIGQPAGGTPYTNSVYQSGGVRTAFSVSSYMIDTLIQSTPGTGGALMFANDSGGMVRARVLAKSGIDTILSGTLADKTSLFLNTQGFTTDTRQQINRLSGTLSLGQTSTAPDPGNGGTISTNTIVALINPAAAETGLILQAGTDKGNIVAVINLSAANSVTFAAVATSNVADGASDTIAPNTTALFVWEVGFNHWYRIR